MEHDTKSCGCNKEAEVTFLNIFMRGFLGALAWHDMTGHKKFNFNVSN